MNLTLTHGLMVTTLLSLVALSGCEAAGQGQPNPKSWEVGEVSWSLHPEPYQLRLPHPSRSSWVRGVAFAEGHRALVIEVTFVARVPERDAVDRWKNRLASQVPSDHLPQISTGSYRLFDSEAVGLVVGASRLKAEVVPTAAQRILLHEVDTQVALLGDHSVPSDFAFDGAFSLRGASQFVGLSRAGATARLVLVYEVKEPFDPPEARLDFFGQLVPLGKQKQIDVKKGQIVEFSGTSQVSGIQIATASDGRSVRWRLIPWTLKTP